MEQLALGGLLLVVATGVWALSRRAAQENDPSQTTILAGLTVALFSVGVFNVGGWLISAVITPSLNPENEIFVRWLFAIPLILAFVLLLDYRQTLPPVDRWRYQRNLKTRPPQPGLRYYRQLRQQRNL